MSASKEKKIRSSQSGEGPSKKETAAAEAAKASKNFRIKTIIAIVVIVVLVAGAAVVSSDIFYTRTTAVQIGSTKYSPAEVNYFYMSTYNQVYNEIYSQLGDYASMVLDTNTPLSEQQYSEDQTWADYIYDATVSEMKRITVLYDKAVSEGYALTAEDENTINSNLQTVQSYADSGNYPSLDSFLAAYYGKGMNEELFVGLLKKALLASDYSVALSETFTYSADELSAYYAEHAEEFDYYNFYLYTVSSAAAAFDDLEEDTKAEAAHNAAEEIAAAADAAEFRAAVSAFIGTDTDVSMLHYTADSMGEAYKAWVTDPARAQGDTTVIDSDGISYAILFDGKDCNDYNTVNMRHILINAEADENGEYTSEALTAARARVEEIQAEWEADPTTDNFALLVAKYTNDTATALKGGLYEDVTKNTMVPEINDFLFNSGAKVGDYKIVYGSNGQYAGYHLVYFDAENGNYADMLAENAMRSADYEAAYEALAAEYSAAQGGGMRYVNLK